jgi:hypothetical protein
MGNDSVFVTNTNSFEHVDRFDGEEFVFPPGVRVLVPIAAATHMLGYNLVDKSDILSRLGWAMKYDPETKKVGDDPEGVKRLAGFVFDEAVMVAKSSLAESVAEIC